MRLLLAKKRGSPRRFHSRAEPKCSRSPRLDHSCLAQPRFSRFYLVWKHFGRPRLLFWHQRRSQLFNLFLFLSVSSSEMTGIAKWFTRHSYVFLCVSNLCISTERKFLRTKPDDAKRSEVSTNFLQSSIYIYLLYSIFLVVLHLISQRRVFQFTTLNFIEWSTKTV